MLRSHRRKTVLTAAALLATTALLTSCQGDSDGGKKTSGHGSSASDSDSKGKSDDDGKSDDADGTESQTGTTTGGTGNGKGSGKGVSGTWFGNVSYLAPGKYTVSDMKDTQQAFFVTENTDIQGAGKICGDADGQAATPCEESELEAAAKKGVSAKVKIENGNAVSVVEDHSSTGGTDDEDGPKPTGTYSGELGFVAAGKYYLVDKNDVRIYFTNHTATTINGNGWICGDENHPNKRCTEGELMAAAKKGGVRVVVKMNNGGAETIDEEHN